MIRAESPVENKPCPKIRGYQESLFSLSQHTLSHFFRNGCIFPFKGNNIMVHFSGINHLADADCEFFFNFILFLNFTILY